MRTQNVYAKTAGLFDRGPGLGSLIWKKADKGWSKRDGGEGSYHKTKSTAFNILRSDHAYTGGIATENIPEFSRIIVNITHD